MSVLSARGVTKRFGATTALADASLEVVSGTVVALCGGNGSGKSTLAKILTGAVARDGGELLLDGEPVRFGSPRAASSAGVVEVWQELSLMPNLTVAENVWLCHEPLRFGAVDVRRRRQDTRSLLELFGGTIRGDITPDTYVSGLSPDERQIVEILKGISSEPRVLILDEATASLDHTQVARLFDLVGRWKQQGMAIIFVSHRLEEVFRIGDSISVLRNGRTVFDSPVGETSRGAVIEQMAGAAARAAHGKRRAERAVDPEVRLRVTDLAGREVRGVSLAVHKGELLGLGGLQRQGQSAVLAALAGLEAHRGKVELDGKELRLRHPRDAQRSGILYVTGDRRSAVFSVRSILENIQLPSWRRYGFPLRVRAARRDAAEGAAQLDTKMASLAAPISSLSGGNAQKVVLARALMCNPTVLLFDDPTKGVDVATKTQIYELLEGLKAEGMSIVLYTSEDDELVSLADRVLVMHDGVIGAELVGDELTHVNLVGASMGVSHADERVTATHSNEIVGLRA